MMSKYLVFLAIGHLLGDFYVQHNIVAGKKDEKFLSIFMSALKYYVAFLLVALPVISVDMILAATYAAIAHLMIATIKYLLLLKGKLKREYEVFIIDQGAHIIGIFALADIMNRWNFSVGYPSFVSYWMKILYYDIENAARWMLAILLIHKPVNIFIQIYLSEFRQRADSTIIHADHNAGRKIGTIERLIMLIFLSRDQFVALGFVLTAKSVARYDKITKDEKFAEYYLLGTLVSTLSVILCRILILP